MALLIGDVRREMGEALLSQLKKIQADRFDKPNYYILVAAKMSPVNNDVIKQTIIILPKRPEVVLGTVLYYADNDKGYLKLEWVWPLDAVVPDFALDKSTEHSTLIYHNTATPGARGRVPDSLN